MELTRGTAHRSPVARTPVIHLLVRNNGDWAMWCSGSRGRPDRPYGNRLCLECRKLAKDGLDNEMFSEAELEGFASA